MAFHRSVVALAIRARPLARPSTDRLPTSGLIFTFALARASTSISSSTSISTRINIHNPTQKRLSSTTSDASSTEIPPSIPVSSTSIDAADIPTLTPPWTAKYLSRDEHSAIAEHGPDYLDHVSPEQRTKFQEGVAARARLARDLEQKYGEDWFSIKEEAYQIIRDNVDNDKSRRDEIKQEAARRIDALEGGVGRRSVRRWADDAFRRANMERRQRGRQEARGVWLIEWQNQLMDEIAERRKKETQETEQAQ